MSSSFQMIPVRMGDDFVARYRCQVWPGETGQHPLDGQTFEATYCYELNLLPDRAELIREAHLRGEGVPKEPSGRSVTPIQPLAAQDHAAFLSDPSPIEAACRPLFGAEKWPEMYRDACYILNKSREEGRWRRNLEVPISAAQVDAHLQTMRETGKRLHHGVPYTSRTFWWDAEAGTFMEHSCTEHPYGGSDREDTATVSEAKMREILEGIPHAQLAERLGR